MMETVVDRFARGVQLARDAGMEIRFANLGGSGGGWCQLEDRSLVFVDLSQEVDQQLDDLESALQMAMSDGPLSADTSSWSSIQHWLSAC